MTTATDRPLDPYRVLQVDPDAEDVVIRAAYRALMKRGHPDRGGDPGLARRLNDAYALLCDPRARAAHDRARRAALAAPPPPRCPPPIELGPGVLSRFRPLAGAAPRWAPTWLFDYVGALRESERNLIWLKGFERGGAGEARALLALVEAARLARPLWSWGSDLFVAVVPELDDAFRAVLRAPRRTLPGQSHAVVAVVPGTGVVRAAARDRRRLPSLDALDASLAIAA